LASRKGTWRYEGTQTAANNAAAQTAHAEPAKEAEPQEVTGTAPQKLDGPRGGVADDLKRIKGIGPKLEQLCHSLGFFHFDQVANWTDEEVAWVDANLEGFKGRVTRDQWVAQAKELAKG
jgi:NADH-quinone oxidoreductase subunit E